MTQDATHALVVHLISASFFKLLTCPPLDFHSVSATRFISIITVQYLLPVSMNAQQAARTVERLPRAFFRLLLLSRSSPFNYIYIYIYIYNINDVSDRFGF